MRIIFLPETEDEPWNMPVTVGTPQRAVLGTYGDTDQFTVAVQPGKRYVVRVLGRETGDGTASTPWMQFAYWPLKGGYASHNLARPWVDGYTKRVNVPVTSTRPGLFMATVTWPLGGGTGTGFGHGQRAMSSGRPLERLNRVWQGG